MHKKGILGMALGNPLFVITLIFILIIFGFIFGISSIQEEGSNQYIKSLRDINDGVDNVFRYLDSEVEFNGNKIVVSDLIRLHCDSSMLDQIKKKTNFLNLPFPIVVSVTCPGGDPELIRGPICEEPKEVRYPKDSKKEIKIDYCLRPEPRQDIKTPDGKDWQYFNEKDLTILWTDGGENFVDEVELKTIYFKYSEPEQVEKRETNFVDMVKNQDEIILPTGENWVKRGDIWCLVSRATNLGVSCESYIISEEKLIECSGLFELCFSQEDLLNE